MPTVAGLSTPRAGLAVGQPRRERAAQAALTLGLGGLVFWLAYDSGSFPLLSRASLALIVWWVIAVGVAVGVLPRARPTTAALVIAAVLAGIVVWTASSLGWASNDQAAFEELARTFLYLGVFVLVALAAPWTGVRPWVEAIPLAVFAVVILALASRFFPGAFTSTSQYRFLSFGQTRLHYPLGYWNGLAIFVMLGLPFLLRLAIGGRTSILRYAAVGTIPAAASVVYLASSRGGVACAVAGAVTFVALTRRRVRALAALAAGAAGGVAAIAMLRVRPELVNDPGSSVVASQGHQAAVLLLVISLVTAAAYAGGELILRQRPPSPRAERIALAAFAAVLLLAMVAANPRERFEEFKTIPQADQIASEDYVGSHLTSLSGNGRWQYWQTALDQFEAHPLVGGGAGSFAEWWTQHRPIAAFALDAHSLYLETLGELGLPGLLLVLGLVTVAAYLVVARPLSARPENTTASALGAAVVAYLVAAGIDWMWELTVVTVVGLAALALLASPPSTAAKPLRLAVSARLAIAAVALVAIVIQALPLLATEQLRRSQDAVARNDASAALDAADDARNIERWAYAPYLQLALIHEQLEELTPAKAAIDNAIERAPRNWQLWLVKARLETKSGDVVEARRSVARIRELNPLGFVAAR